MKVFGRRLLRSVLDPDMSAIRCAYSNSEKTRLQRKPIGRAITVAGPTG